MRTGIKSLKVGYNKVFGYYIEVPKTYSSKIPRDYIRKQTLTNAERYITPELKEFETKVLNAEERVKELEYQLFLEVRDKICAETDSLLKLADAIATLDVISTLAEVAVSNRYTKPIVDDSDIIEIKGGRHPVVEKIVEEEFIPNDTYLDNKNIQIMIITGPNMAGKSTYIRQVALITLLAHIGSFVPADYARIGITDRIFTRVGAVDDISRRQSTFMVEMLETANILNNATDKSLIILDEIGRGTSTFDGMSIAWAVIEYIHNYIGAKTLFATHYHHITQIEKILPRVRNYHISVAEYENKMVFLRKVVEGPTDKSYGIHVARLAGLPQEVINRAEKILQYIESTSNIEIPVEIIKRDTIPENNKGKLKEIPKEEELLPEIEVKANEKRPTFKEKLIELEKEKEEEDKTIKKGQATLEDFV